MKRILRVRDELDLNGSHADAIRAVQKILSDELDRIENDAWEFYGVERTPDAVEKVRAWIEYERSVKRFGPDDVHPEELSPTEAQMLFLTISMCRTEIDRWLIPEIAVSLLVMAGRVHAVVKSEKSIPTVADIMSIVGKRAAHSRHAENREKAKAIKAWYRENSPRYRSMDAAAEAVAALLDVSFRTARKHIGDEARKLRSASKV